MKPVSLCLVHVGKKGLELVGSYPKTIPTEMMNQIVLKSMPLGAKPGDFLTTTTGGNNFSGYVFRVPSNVGRDNLATLVAVFDTEEYNAVLIRKIFATTLLKLEENNLVNVETITRLLPEMYNGINKGRLKIKISSIVMLEFDFESEIKQGNKTEEKVSDIRKELWR